MNTREEILARCRAAIGERFDMPSLDDLVPISWEDPIAVFRASVEKAGGKVIDGVTGEDAVLPDTATVRGELGVAENGCVWVPQDGEDRSEIFKCEHLVIMLSRKRILNNMHEAYKQISFNDYGYGCFISGPSKTADIAQVLVMGAQAARSLTVILTD